MFILEQEIARHGLNWKAVGKYHSPDRECGRYAWKIYRHYVGMGEDKEPNNGKATHGSQKLSDPGGMQRHSGVSPQGRVAHITFRPKIKDQGRFHLSACGTQTARCVPSFSKA